ncbi:hypothetical protein EXU85_02780 [Spirosoma sp. KCTC 42546]|uniref:hypothetical protein n=1 Tax=Spirosoma sp. KCTC 42546 TaxID=2520506 RepID=UPI001159B193|nr:hypothetical protein [Spirosoma sp. KCTC 42546]QDK77575.1 hypothetical protein EXU85_02780 [Spirosoma sp. KCTC 42546]
MELDEFKALYQAHFELVPDKSGTALEEMLRKRSYTAIERILRNLLWEVGAALVILLVLAFVMVTWSSTVFRWVGGFLVMLSVIQVVAFIRQYRQLSARLNWSPGTVKQYLQEMEAIVSRFVRVYYRYCMRSIPVAMVVGGLFGGYVGVTDNRTDPAFSALPERPTILFVVMWLVFSVLLVIGTYFMLKWYIQRLYGQYLDELKACITQLD